MLVFLASSPLWADLPTTHHHHSSFYSPLLHTPMRLISSFAPLLWHMSKVCNLALSQALHTSVWPPHPTPERRLADHYPHSLHFRPHYLSLFTLLQCRHISCPTFYPPPPAVQDMVTVLGSLAGKKSVVVGRRETPPAWVQMLMSWRDVSETSCRLVMSWYAWKSGGWVTGGDGGTNVLKIRQMMVR